MLSCRFLSVGLTIIVKEVNYEECFAQSKVSTVRGIDTSKNFVAFEDRLLSVGLIIIVREVNYREYFVQSRVSAVKGIDILKIFVIFED